MVKVQTITPLDYLKAVLDFNKASFKVGNKPIDTLAQSISPKLALGLQIPFFNKILVNNSPETRKELYLQIPLNADLRKARLKFLEEESENLTAFEILQKQLGGDYDFNNFISFLPQGFRAKYTNETVFNALAEELNKGDNSIFAPNNEREAIFALPTGTGKTGIFALIASLMRKDQKVMIIVPSLVLNDQIAEVCQKLYPHKTVSFISSSKLDKQSTGQIKNNFKGDIIIVVEDSFRTVMDRMKEENISIKPAMIICDEFHLYENANGFTKAFDEFIEYCKKNDKNKKSEKPIIFKFSATPYPAKIKKQNDTDIPVIVGNTIHWLDPKKVPSGKIICQISPAEAIKQGELCNIKWKSVKFSFDLDPKLIKSLDDESGVNNEETLSKKIRLSWENIVQKYIDLYKTDTEQHNKKILAVCPFIKNATYAAEEFCKQTRRVSAVVSSVTNCIFTTQENGTVQRQNFTRKEILEKYRNKEIEAIFNVRVLREGVDFPDIEAIWMMTPTNAVDNYLQFIGRGMRLDPNHPNKVLQIIDLVPETYSLISPLTAPRVFGFPNPEEGELLFADKSNNEKPGNLKTKNNLVTIDHSGFYDSFLSLGTISAKIRIALRKEKLAIPEPAELYKLILAEADKMHEKQDWKFIICSDSPISISQSLISLYEEKNNNIIHNLRFNYSILMSAQKSLIKELKAKKEESLKLFTVNNSTTTQASTSLLAQLTGDPKRSSLLDRPEGIRTVAQPPQTTIKFEEDAEIGKANPQSTLKKNTQLYYLQQSTVWKELLNEFIKQLKSEEILDAEFVENNKECLAYYFYDRILKPSEQRLLLNGESLNNNDNSIKAGLKALKEVIKEDKINRIIKLYTNNSSVYLPGQEGSKVNSTMFFDRILAHTELSQTFDQVKAICKNHNIPEWVILESFIGNQTNRLKLNYILNDNIQGNSEYINCLPIFALTNLIEYVKKDPNLQQYLYCKQKEIIDQNINNKILWTTRNNDIFHLKMLINSTLFERILEENSNTTQELSEVKQDFIVRICFHPTYKLNILKYLCTNQIRNLEKEIKDFLIEVVNINSNLNEVFDKSTALQKLSNLYFSRIVNNLILSNNRTILLGIQEGLANLPYNLTVSDQRKESVLHAIKITLLKKKDLKNKIYEQVINHSTDFKTIELEIQQILLNEIKQPAKYIELSNRELDEVSKRLLPQVMRILKENNITLLLHNEVSVQRSLIQGLREKNLEFNLDDYIEQLLNKISKDSKVHTDLFSKLPKTEQQYFLSRIKILSQSTELVGYLNDEQKTELSSLIREHYSQTNNNFVSASLFTYLLTLEIKAERDISFSEVEKSIPDTYKKTESVYNPRTNTEKQILFIDKTKLPEIIKLLQTTKNTFTRNAALNYIKIRIGDLNNTLIETRLDQVLKQNDTKIITQPIINKTIQSLIDLLQKKKEKI